MKTLAEKQKERKAEEPVKVGQNIQVEVNWNYTEPTAEWKRLMMLLLKSPDSQSAEIIRADAER